MPPLPCRCSRGHEYTRAEAKKKDYECHCGEKITCTPAANDVQASTPQKSGATKPLISKKAKK